MIDEPFQEQQFCGAGGQLVVEVGEDAFVLNFSGERRVGEDDVELLASMETRACSNWWR